MPLAYSSRKPTPFIVVRTLCLAFVNLIRFVFLIFFFSFSILFVTLDKAIPIWAPGTSFMMTFFHQFFRSSKSIQKAYFFKAFGMFLPVLGWFFRQSTGRAISRPRGCEIGPELIRPARRQVASGAVADTHFARACNVVRSSLESSDRIARAQSAAAEQLDAAEYALHRMIEDLSSVMENSINLPRYANRPQGLRTVSVAVPMAA